MSSSLVRFSMKYLVDQLGGGQRRTSRRRHGDGLGWPGPQDARRAALADRAASCARREHLDTPHHSVPVDFVHVERLAEAAEQHDGQRPAEVLAELLQAVGEPTRLTRSSRHARELRRKQVEADRDQQVEDPPQSCSGRKPCRCA